jgi:hypothetical protein
MTSSFIAGADSFANTVSGQDTTPIRLARGKEFQLIIKGPKIFQLIIFHVGHDSSAKLIKFKQLILR